MHFYIEGQDRMQVVGRPKVGGPKVGGPKVGRPKEAPARCLNCARLLQNHQPRLVHTFPA